MTALVSENTIDSRSVRSRCACTEVRLYTQLSCVCLWTSWVKGKKQGRNDVSVQRSTSMKCTFCQLLVLRTFTRLLNWKRCSKALSRHHSSVIPVCTIRTIQDSTPKFLRRRLCSQSTHMFREEICSVVLRVHSTHR